MSRLTGRRAPECEVRPRLTQAGADASRLATIRHAAQEMPQLCKICLSVYCEQADGRAGALNAGLAAAFGEAGAGGRDAVAVLHAHQALAPGFFEAALPALAASAATALVRGRGRLAWRKSVRHAISIAIKHGMSTGGCQSTT